MMIIPGKEIRHFTSDKYAVEYKKAKTLERAIEDRAEQLHGSFENQNDSRDSVVVANCNGVTKSGNQFGPCYHIISAHAEYEPLSITDDCITRFNVRSMNVKERGLLGPDNYSLINNDTKTVYKHSHLGLCQEVSIDKKSGDMTISNSFLGIQL